MYFLRNKYTIQWPESYYILFLLAPRIVMLL